MIGRLLNGVGGLTGPQKMNTIIFVHLLGNRLPGVYFFEIYITFERFKFPDTC